MFNKRYFQYEGIIHEQVACKDDTVTYHIGYTKEMVNKTNKLKRNKDILIKAIDDKSNDPYFYFQLGKTDYIMKYYSASASYFEKVLTYQLDCRLEYVTDLIET